MSKDRARHLSVFSELGFERQIGRLGVRSHFWEQVVCLIFAAFLSSLQWFQRHLTNPTVFGGASPTPGQEILSDLIKDGKNLVTATENAC